MPHIFHLKLHRRTTPLPHSLPFLPLPFSFHLSPSPSICYHPLLYSPLLTPHLPLLQFRPFFYLPLHSFPSNLLSSSSSLPLSLSPSGPLYLSLNPSVSLPPFLP